MTLGVGDSCIFTGFHHRSKLNFTYLYSFMTYFGVFLLRKRLGLGSPSTRSGQR